MAVPHWIPFGNVGNCRCDFASCGTDLTVSTVVSFACVSCEMYVRHDEHPEPSELLGDFNWLAKHRPIKRWNTRSLGRSTMRRWTETVN